MFVNVLLFLIIVINIIIVNVINIIVVIVILFVAIIVIVDNNSLTVGLCYLIVFWMLLCYLIIRRVL